jgi:hypothetical protein
LRLSGPRAAAFPPFSGIGGFYPNCRWEWLLLRKSGGKAPKMLCQLMIKALSNRELVIILEVS